MEFSRSIQRQSKMYSVAQCCLLEADGNVTVDVVFAQDANRVAGRRHMMVQEFYTNTEAESLWTLTC